MKRSTSTSAILLCILLILGFRTSVFATTASEVLSLGGPRSVPDATIDATGTLTVEDVARGRFKAVRSAAGDGTDSAYHWYRLVPPRPGSVPIVLRLHQIVADADLYFRRYDGSLGLVRFGMRVPFIQRSYPVAWPVTLLTDEMRAKGELYLRTSGDAGRISVEPERGYADFRADIARVTFAFVGFFASIGILSLFLWLYLRESSYGLQAILMLVASLYTLTENELAWQFLWPTLSVDYELADGTLFIAYLFTTLLFVRSFLSIRTTLPVIDRALWVIFALNCLFTLVVIPLSDNGVIDVVAPLVNFIPFPILLLAAILRRRSGFEQARFFIAGLASLIAIFLASGIFHHYSITRWGFDLGVAFDSMFFQFALADRVMVANRARDQAQRGALAAQKSLVESQNATIELLQRHNSAFNRFVPREFLVQLGRSDVTEIKLGDHIEREMTVLFADIRAFTTLSEQMTPGETFSFINSILARAGPIVREKGGFVDKYIGDGLMALFDGESDSALEAAISLQHSVRRFNEDRARALKEPIAMGVGLHRGELMLGTIGEDQRLETTVVSDAVNVASRLQDLTKSFGARIIASDAVIVAARESGTYRLRPLTRVNVRGIARRLKLFEVCDADDPETLLRKMSTIVEWEEAVRAFDADDFASSRILFKAIVNGNPRDLPAAYGLSQSIAMGKIRLSHP